MASWLDPLLSCLLSSYTIINYNVPGSPDATEAHREPVQAEVIENFMVKISSIIIDVIRIHFNIDAKISINPQHVFLNC